MARRDGMQPVELVERDVAQDRPTDDERAARRRPSRRWLAVAGLVVVALVGTQLVVAARERAAVAALAQVSGVVRPVDADLGLLWTPKAGVEAVLGSGIVADGTFIGLQHLPDNAQAVVAVDERTGARRWTTPLADAHEVDHGDDGFGTLGGCVAEPGQTGRAACLVTDAFLTYRDTASVYVPSTTSRLVVVDLGDGSVVADRPAPSVAAFTVLPGMVVTAVPGTDRGAVLTAADLVTGEERWRTAVPAPPAADTSVDRGFSDGSTSLFATADGLGVVLAGRRITLLDPRGAVVRSDLDANVGYLADPRSGTVAAYALDDQGSPSTTIVGGGPDLVLPGRQVDVGADDGSVPGVVLMADTTVRAYDRATGDVRWTVRHVIAGNALVLRGRVYLSTGGGVVAIDGRTGEELWRAPAAPGRTLDGLVTDGRHLLSSQQRPEEAGDVRSPDDWPGVGVLVAYRFEDGGEDWRVDLPAGVLGVGTVGRSLVGWGSATAVLG